MLNNTPPMFNAIATGDFLFRSQFGVVEAWFKADRPVLFHLYQNGGYRFGPGNPRWTGNRWFDATETTKIIATTILLTVMTI